MATAPSRPTPSTLRTDFERGRLEARARGLRLAVMALRARSGASASFGRMPPALHRAITEFSAELSSVEERLAPGQVRAPGGSTKRRGV